MTTIVRLKLQHDGLGPRTAARRIKIAMESHGVDLLWAEPAPEPERWFVLEVAIDLGRQIGESDLPATVDVLRERCEQALR